eukprot:scaffold8900_cov119-Isochrysis_galbana.AAC.3
MAQRQGAGSVDKTTYLTANRACWERLKYPWPAAVLRSCAQLECGQGSASPWHRSRWRRRGQRSRAGADFVLQEAISSPRGKQFSRFVPLSSVAEAAHDAI